MTSHFAVRQFCLLSLLIFMLATTSHLNAQSGSCQASGKMCTLTWQQDTTSEVCSGCAYRTGENLSESTITPSSIQTDNFGQLCSYTVDGQVYAQPLVVTNVTILNPHGTFDIAYVVTQNNTLYAFNATPGTTGSATCPLLMHKSISSYLPQGQQTAVSCHKIGGKETIANSVGILGTPVIQPSGTGGTIYLLTYTQDSAGTNFYHYLHALDITTLQEETNSPVLVCPPGQTCPSPNAFSFYHIQRPGLLLANCDSAAPCNGKTYVYVAFSMMDGYPAPSFPNGAIFGYDAANLKSDTNVFYLQTSVGQSSNVSTGGGIWMGGAAPAFGPDASKNWIYLKTGNGSFTLSANGGTDAGDSFLKIDANGLVIQNDNQGNNLGYLTPVDEYFRSSWTLDQQTGRFVPTCASSTGDIDFGSGGVMLIPDNELPNWKQLTVGGDKEGGLWFIDRNSPGKFQNTCSFTPYSLCSCQPTPNYTASGNVQTFWTGSPYGVNSVIQGGMAYWEYDISLPGLNYAYAAQYGGQLFQYPLCAKSSASYPIDETARSGSSPVGSMAGGQAVDFPTGTTPTISADTVGASDAIVWAIGKQTLMQNPLPTAPGTLYAFDAVSMQQLYSSNNSCAADAIYPSTKFSVPTVANGYVYLGTESVNTNSQNSNLGTFYIFGPGRTSGGSGC